MKKLKRKGSKSLAVLLLLIVLLSMIQLPVFAEELNSGAVQTSVTTADALENAFTNAQNGDTITSVQILILMMPSFHLCRPLPQLFRLTLTAVQLHLTVIAETVLEQ